MELVSSSCLEALQLSNKYDKFSDEIFENTLRNLVNFLSKSGRDNDIQGICPGNLDLAFQKQTVPAFMTLLIEAAKTDASPEQLSLILDDCEFPSHRKNILLDLYKSKKQHIRARLAKIGSTPPHIVDVDWKLDYNLQNNQSSKVMELQYTVALKTDQNACGNPSNVQFSCSREQLQDFVGKLKEAVKSVERASQS